MTAAPDQLHLPAREGYDLWSSSYDVEVNPLILMEERHFTRWLGDCRSLRVLDLGCGTGRHAIPLAGAGAEVLAVDFSSGMLAQARTKPGAKAVRFLQHDLSAPLPEPDASFDRVLCCLVLDHLSGLPALMVEAARLCRPRALVLVTVLHPAMMLAGVQARFTDPRSGKVVWPASAQNQISDYVTAASRAGFGIELMEEHFVDDELVKVSPKVAKYLRWPLLLALKLHKPGAPIPP